MRPTIQFSAAAQVIEFPSRSSSFPSAEWVCGVTSTREATRPQIGISDNEQSRRFKSDTRASVRGAGWESAESAAHAGLAEISAGQSCPQTLIPIPYETTMLTLSAMHNFLQAFGWAFEHNNFLVYDQAAEILATWPREEA